MQIITRLRKANKIIDGPGWNEALEFCDSGITDALQLLQGEGLPAPDIGVDVQDSASRVIGTLEAAWAGVKVALLFQAEAKDIKRSGGKCLN